MRFCKLLSYDLCRGSRLKNYLYAALIFAIRTLTVHRLVQIYCRAENAALQESAGDLMLYMFQGMAIPQSGSVREALLIPAGWLIVCGLCLYLTAAYSAQCISVQGQQVFLRTSRGKWWLSKCIWCTVSCAAYFVCEMAIIALLTPSALRLGNTPEITAFLFSEVLWGETVILTPTQVMLCAVLLPFVSLTALCMLQTCLNLVIRPAISFLACFLICIISAYFPSEWLIGNGAMVMRCRLFDPDGLHTQTELIAALLVYLLAVTAGYLLIRKKDLIALEK